MPAAKEARATRTKIDKGRTNRTAEGRKKSSARLKYIIITIALKIALGVKVRDQEICVPARIGISLEGRFGVGQTPEADKNVRAPIQYRHRRPARFPMRSTFHCITNARGLGTTNGQLDLKTVQKLYCYSIRRR